MLLTKSQILAADDLPTADVAVPEWGGVVRVASITAQQLDEFNNSLRIVGPDGKGVFSTLQIRAKLCALCIVGPDGRRVFDDDDVEELGQKSAAALERVYIKANKLAGMDDSDREAIEKNSAPTAEDAG